MRGVARSFSVGEGEGKEATDYLQNEPPITDKYINANVPMSTKLFSVFPLPRVEA